jgi:hypothetical protein
VQAIFRTIVLLKIIVYSIKSVKRNDFPVINTQGSLDSPVVNTARSLERLPCDEYMGSRLLGVFRKSIGVQKKFLPKKRPGRKDSPVY